MSVFSGLEHVVRQGEVLAPFTWLKIGGPAEFFAEPTSAEELQTLVQRCRENDVPIHVLGGGSNLLIHDEGVPGMVVRLDAPAFSGISVAGRRLTAGGGAKLSHAVSTAVREGLAGLDALVGIPGTVGGALHGNAGGKGGDIGQWTQRATVLTRAGEILQRSRDDLIFAYRQSSLDELVILSAEFELEEHDPEQLVKRMQKQWIVKKASQPMAHQNAGCIFKNAGGLSAGDLIEQSGLKGARIGGAEVSQQHANFIVAHQGATCQDVMRLIDLMKSRVHERLGSELETEIQIW